MIDFIKSRKNNREKNCSFAEMELYYLYNAKPLQRLYFHNLPMERSTKRIIEKTLNLKRSIHFQNK